MRSVTARRDARPLSIMPISGPSPQAETGRSETSADSSPWRDVTIPARPSLVAYREPAETYQ